MQDLETEVERLRAALGLKNKVLQARFGLTDAMADMLGMLVSQEYVTPEVTGYVMKTPAKVAVYRLRRALEPHSIKVRSNRTLGYWLEQSDKDKIKEKMDGQQ